VSPCAPPAHQALRSRPRLRISFSARSYRPSVPLEFVRVELRLRTLDAGGANVHTHTHTHTPRKHSGATLQLLTPSIACYISAARQLIEDCSGVVSDPKSAGAPSSPFPSSSSSSSAAQDDSAGPSLSAIFDTKATVAGGGVRRSRELTEEQAQQAALLEAQAAAAAAGADAYAAADGSDMEGVGAEDVDGGEEAEMPEPRANSRTGGKRSRVGATAESDEATGFPAKQLRKKGGKRASLG
jgi:hypothetical protein